MLRQPFCRQFPAAGKIMRSTIASANTHMAPARGLSSKSTTKVPNGPDPYLYTSGRWLHRDQLQRAARSIDFDFPALCVKAVSLCPGARQITSYEKKEGGFNRVFIFTMDNGACVIARLPFRVAGPERLTTNSEVATMAYIRQKTNIPVPDVLEWNDDKKNPIGSEYIIMNHAPGVQLHGLWPGMDAAQHMLTVKALSRIIQSMATLSFPAYGSIYFANAPIDHQLKIPLGEFCIGPHSGHQYWDHTPGEPRYYERRKPNRGPWANLSEYTAALIDLGYSRIPTAEAAPQDELPYRGSIQEHLRLMKINEEVMPALIQSPSIQGLATPTLLHADLHKRNIFVSEDDPTVISSIIDWQLTSIEPAFVYAKETPDLVLIRPPPKSEIPKTGETVVNEPSEAEDEPPETSEEKKEREKMEHDIWISRQTFEVGMKAWVPRIFAARTADDTLLRPLRYCGTSWRDSAAATCQELIELSQRWTELGLPGQCLYQPTEKELSEHSELYEEFQNVQNLKAMLVESLETEPEGWVHPDDWEAIKSLHKGAFDNCLEEARESDDEAITPEYMEKMWPFDIEKGRQ